MLFELFVSNSLSGVAERVVFIVFELFRMSLNRTSPAGGECKEERILDDPSFEVVGLNLVCCRLSTFRRNKLSKKKFTVLNKIKKKLDITN